MKEKDTELQLRVVFLWSIILEELVQSGVKESFSFSSVNHNKWRIFDEEVKDSFFLPFKAFSEL